MCVTAASLLWLAIPVPTNTGNYDATVRIGLFAPGKHPVCVATRQAVDTWRLPRRHHLSRQRSPGMPNVNRDSASAFGWRQSPERPLLDRSSERTRIDDVLESVRHGFSGVLVLRGSPGAGKTSLLAYAVGAASGFRISAVAGVYSEINLPYGAVHQLLIPFLPLIDDLPVPQQQALRVAFGLEAGPPPERFLVGLACMTLVSRAAADRPVLCAIDDAHWIDAESALVLGFLARRLYADRVGIMLTVGDAGQLHDFQQLPTIEVGGLPENAAAELLHSVSGAPLPSAVVHRVAADTERNPLALVEIGSHFTVGELTARAYLPEPIPVGRQLAERFLDQVRQLPGDVREFVLLVAADASGDRSRVRQAAAAARIDADAAETAVQEAELIKVSGNGVGFRHPLIRRAVYHQATDAGRRRAHHLLSHASGSQGDADGRVWHAAAAAAEPDENLAADLHAAARRSRDRGASSAAAALLRRSASLTPDQVIRARREVELASAELVIGLPETARQVAADALPRLPDSRSRGEANVVIGDALFAQGRAAEAAQALADAAAALAADPAASADALMTALNAAIWAGPAETRKIAMIPPPSPANTPRVSDLLLAGCQARFAKGYDDAAAPLRAAVSALRADDLDPVAGLKWFLRGTIAAGSLWDDEAMVDITGRWVRVTRQLGALAAAPVALAFRAIADCMTGRLDQAADGWAEMRELMAASQTAGMFGIDSGAQGLLLAYRGQIAQARVAGLAQIRQSTARGQSTPASMGRSIVALAEMLDGDCEAAVDTASTVIRDDPVFIAETTLPVLIEAAVRSDHHDVALGAFATLADRARIAGTPWALGLRARCQALLEESSKAEAAYLEAISQLGRSRAALDLARAHLLYGQWLRRGQRRRDARGQLRTAEDMFHAMGAAGLAQQAGNELRATGERARKRTLDTEFDLTPQEARVASLAASGAANIQIAEQLFISPSTVDYHLGKVFRKLGVRSRTQLAHQLPVRS
ncbi:MAG TPA: LuxR C-terminal-related transcriptional regulator [Streptosporangiaceae bacterium]